MNPKHNNLLFIFCYTVAGWIIYSPMTSWLISNPDGIYLGVIYREGDGSAAFGRIGVGAVIRLMQSVVSPNLMMILSLIMLGVVICLLADIFNIDSLWGRIVMGALLLLSPSMSSQLTYYYCMVQYILAFVITVLACYLIIKIKHPAIVIVSALLIMAQMTLYQAYMSVAVVLSINYLMYQLLNKEEYKTVIMTAVKLLVSMFLGLVMYILLLKVLHVELDPNRGFDSMGRLDIRQQLGLVKTAYWSFFDYLFGNEYINNSWMYRNGMNLLVVMAIILTIAYTVVVGRLFKQAVRVLMILACLAALPVGFELMVIAAPKVPIHGTTGIIMIPAMSMLYMSVIWLWRLAFSCGRNDEEPGRVRKWFRSYGSVLILAPILYNFILFTSVFENVMWLNYQSMYSLCQKISTRMDEVGGYEPDVRIAFIGYPQDGDYPFNRDELRDIVRGTLAEKGQIWEGSKYLSSCVFQAFYRTYFGIDYNIIESIEYDEIISSGRTEEMGNFPEKNSVVRDGNLIIVKVSDE